MRNPTKLPHRKNSSNRSSENGFTLVMVMILLALTAFVVSQALKRTQSGTLTVYEAKRRSELYYEAETSLHKVLIALRSFGHIHTAPFRRGEFYSKFDRLNVPAIGTNDVSALNIPTQIVVDGTSNAPILTQDSALGTAAFPASTNLISGAAVDVASVFAGANFGDAKVRLTLIDAVAETPANDGPTPTTDFDPIYRIDSMTDINSGAHLFGIVRGDIINLFDYGLYGKTSLNFAGTCDSYASTSGDYAVGIRAAGCPAGSYSTSDLTLTGTIYGNLRTNYSAASTSGLVCRDFTGGCPNAGKVCLGRECAANLLDQYQSTFASYCPTDQGTLLAVSSQAVTTAGGNCWSGLGSRTGVTLTLSSCLGCAPAGPYYANTMLLQSATAVLRFNPSVAGGILEYYFWNVTAGTIAASNILNVPQRPYQVRLYYMGTADLAIIGTTQPLRAFIVAPYAQVTVAQNVKIYGGLIADRVIVNSGAEIHYDSTLAGEGLVEDMQYQLRQVNQVFR